MRKVVYILVIILLASCGSLSKTRKSDASGAKDGDQLYISKLVEPEQPDELTASLSLNISGRKISGQLRMRRDHSIQISASLLGLMEVARIEFLPDKVVVVDRINSRYSICHYAFLPLRNVLGLDFQQIQSILWNRAFSFDSNGVFDVLNHSTDSFEFKETKYGYVFKADANGHLASTVKPQYGRVDYSDFNSLAKDFTFPLEMTVTVNTSDLSLNVPIRLSSVSTTKQNWPDQTQLPRRLQQVELEDILDDLTL